MKSPFKSIITAIIFGAIFLNVGFSFAQNSCDICTDNNKKIFLEEDQDNAERKKEFWDKFRESVKPREKNPPAEAEKPREVRPREIHVEEDE